MQALHAANGATTNKPRTQHDTTHNNNTVKAFQNPHSKHHGLIDTAQQH